MRGFDYMVCVGGGCVEADDEQVDTASEALDRAYELAADPDFEGEPVQVIVGALPDPEGGFDEPRVPPLAGFAEAAEILGVSTSNLQKVAGLPEPVARLKSGSVWLVSDLRALARKRKTTAA